VLTLFTTPVIYIYLDKLRNLRRARDPQARPGPPGAPQPETSPP
jgi:hypothetical protein